MSALSPTIGMLLAGRLIQGIGASIGMTVLAFMTFVPAMSLFCLASYVAYLRCIRRSAVLTDGADAAFPAE